MEEIEIMSWLTLDAIKNAAEVKETVGDLQIGHCKSVFSDATKTKKSSRSLSPNAKKKKEKLSTKKIQDTMTRILPTMEKKKRI